MEQQARRNELNPERPFEGSTGNGADQNKLSHLAGHISLHDMPHAGEISLDEQQKRPVVDRTERSAWHAIAFDKFNNIIEQPYGQAFQQERQPEQIAHGKAVAGHVIAAAQKQPDNTFIAAQPSTEPAQPISTPSQPVPVPVNPLYATMKGSQNTPGHPVPETSVPTVPTHPYSPIEAAAPEQQAVTANPMGAQSAQPTVQPQPVNLQGAINPSFAQPTMPAAPIPQEPQLPEGKHADIQHRLPMSKSHLKMYLTSPWLWLVIGIAMVIYFATTIFNS